jgi:UDP-glucose 4-epimerase
MKVVVTGGAGFIGANLCRRLVSAPGIDEVVALDDLSTGAANNVAGIGNVSLRVGSILDPTVVEGTVGGASTVIHLAARPSVSRSLEDPIATHEANATGTLRVLEACRHAGDIHIIVASSSSIYGMTPVLPKHEQLPPAPASPYAASKLAGESYALSYARSFGLDVLAFRLFNVFGPMQTAGHAYAAAIPAFLSAALKGRPLTVHGDGTQTRDFTYIGSVTEVLTDAVLRRVTFDGPVNLAFGGRTSLLELIELIERLISRPVAVEHVKPRPGDVLDSQADSSRMRSLFPDRVPVRLEEGLRDTIRWLEANRKENGADGD